MPSSKLGNLHTLLLSFLMKTFRIISCFWFYRWQTWRQIIRSLVNLSQQEAQLGSKPRVYVVAKSSVLHNPPVLPMGYFFLKHQEIRFRTYNINPYLSLHSQAAFPLKPTANVALTQLITPMAEGLQALSLGSPWECGSHCTQQDPASCSRPGESWLPSDLTEPSSCGLA